MTEHNAQKLTVEITENLDNKDFFASLVGKWCSDFGELDQFTKAEVSRVKQIITMTTDRDKGPI